MPRLPLGMTMLMEDGHAASMKSRSRGLRRWRTGSSCLMEEIHMDMGRSCAAFFTLELKTEEESAWSNDEICIIIMKTESHLYALTTASGLLQAATST